MNKGIVRSRSSYLTENFLASRAGGSGDMCSSRAFCDPVASLPLLHIRLPSRTGAIEGDSCGAGGLDSVGRSEGCRNQETICPWEASDPAP